MSEASIWDRGDKIRFGTIMTVLLGAGATTTYSIDHTLSDDVDMSFSITTDQSLIEASKIRLLAVGVDGRLVHEGAGTTPIPGALPASGKINVTIVNNGLTGQIVTFRYRLEERS